MGVKAIILNRTKIIKYNNGDIDSYELCELNDIEKVIIIYMLCDSDPRSNR